MNNTNLKNNNGGNDMPINAMSNEAVENATGIKKPKGACKIHAGIDAGNGYFKYFYQNFRDLNDKGVPKTKQGAFESVLDIDATNSIGDISEGNIVFINNHRCKVNSGVRIGEREECTIKQNEHTRANFYFSLLSIYLEANKKQDVSINDFYVALGTTTDIYEDEDYREEYRQFMLGNTEYDMYSDKPLEGRITFKYYNPSRKEFSTATINIKELLIYPEGTPSLMDLDIKSNGFDFEKKTIILDIGTQTAHAITYNKKTATYHRKPDRRAGYVQLINSLILPLSRASKREFTYQDAEVEFKRRDDGDFSEVIDKAVAKFIKDSIEPQLDGAKVMYDRDQIVVTGGTSIAIRSDLEHYFREKHGKELMFVKDGFFANSKGLLMHLNKELKLRRIEG